MLDRNKLIKLDADKSFGIEFKPTAFRLWVDFATHRPDFTYIWDIFYIFHRFKNSGIFLGGSQILTI
jgi:hypothetical protein